MASYLNNVLKPYIEKSKFVCKNSFDYAEMIKNAKLSPYEKMDSYDASALFPLVPISNAIEHIRGDFEIKKFFSKISLQ